jgi:hypothetical protein
MFFSICLTPPPEAPAAARCARKGLRRLSCKRILGST